MAIFKAWVAGFEKSVAISTREKIISLVPKCGSWLIAGRLVVAAFREFMSMPFEPQ
jgi:hypothetical protein